MDRDSYLWKIYAEVARAFNTEKLPHTVLHGVDYDKNIVGRDCDMLVRRKDMEKAISLTKGAFLQSTSGGGYFCCKMAMGLLVFDDFCNRR